MSQADAEETMRRLAREEGLFAGVSSGGAVWSALQLSRELANAVIVNRSSLAFLTPVSGNYPACVRSEVVEEPSRAELEDDFAQTLGEVQRTAESFLTGGILIITGVLLIGGITLSRRFLLQNQELQNQ